jgi:hypothetical protein
MIPQTKETVVIHNNRQELLNFYESHKDSIFVGYNIRGYDQYILKGLILDMNVKEINDFIIVDKRFGWEFSNLFNDVQLYFYDAMIKGNSLKQLEGFMGESMVESDVSFDIDRPLTPPELESTIKYCKHDVEQLICVFMNTKEEFDSQISLLKAFNLPMKYISKTKPQLSAMILGARKRIHNDEFNLILP